MSISNSFFVSVRHHRINNTKKRTFRILRCLAVTAALATCASSYADVELIKIGDPLWEPRGNVATSFHFQSLFDWTINADFQMAQEAVLNALGSSHTLPNGPLSDGKITEVMFPGQPHVDPYDNEIRRAMAAQGRINTDVFEFQEIRKPDWVSFTIALVPSENAPMGPSPDSALGPVIPNDVFPITRKGGVTFNGGTPNCRSRCTSDRIDSLDSFSSFVDTDGEVHDVTGLNWSHIVDSSGTTWADPNRSESRILGSYVRLVEYRDVNGDGWDVINRYNVRRPTNILGDLSYHGGLDMDDLNILTQNIAVGATNLKLDMNGDETVDVADVHFWVTVLNSMSMGDANLDGEVDFEDFLALSENFSKPGGWSQGDFDTNERVDFADFLILSENFGASSATAAAVPEPSSLALLGFAGTFGALRRRR